MKGHRALAASLAAEGVEVLFGVLGDGNMELVVDLVEDHGVRFVAARHEAGAVAMADGYTRASGRPGVCTVTHGPGLTQVGTPLVNAARARSAVLVVASETAAAARLHAQAMDQGPFAAATASWQRRLRMPETIAEDVGLAFRALRLGAGPGVLHAGLDVQDADVSRPHRPVRSTSLLPPPQRIGPDPARIEAALATIAASRRPVVVAGRGAVAARVHGQALAFAERIGALVGTTLLARTWFDGHPLDLGVVGGFGRPVAADLLAEADLVVALGAGLNRFTADNGRLFPDATILQVDSDASVVGDPVPVADAVVGDVGLFLDAVLKELSVEPGWTGTDAAQRLARPDTRDEGTEHDEDGIDPRVVVASCDRHLPADRMVVVGIGHYSGWPARAMGLPDPEALVLPWEFGAVSLGLPVGIGVAVARPDRTTVVFEGDGGVLMSLAELDTAAREALDLVVVVMDDAAYGAEVHALRARGRSDSLARFPSRDLHTAAAALGCTARQVARVDELPAACRAAAASTPALLQVRIDAEVVDELVFAALRP